MQPATLIPRTVPAGARRAEPGSCRPPADRAAAHDLQRALVRQSLLLLDGRDKPTSRRWA